MQADQLFMLEFFPTISIDSKVTKRNIVDARNYYLLLHRRKFWRVLNSGGQVSNRAIADHGNIKKLPARRSCLTTRPMCLSTHDLPRCSGGELTPG